MIPKERGLAIVGIRNKAVTNCAKIMSVAGDCLEIPTYIDSIGECTGEYLGLEEQESAYA